MSHSQQAYPMNHRFRIILYILAQVLHRRDPTLHSTTCSALQVRQKAPSFLHPKLLSQL